MESIKAILTRLKGFLETSLFKLGETQITLLSVAYFFLLLILLVYLSGKSKTIVNRVLARRGVALGIREATGSIVRYLMLFIGLLVILQTVGIDLTALSILTGAVGLGIGFGLQNIASNFISGLIILFERPVRIGDRIAVGDVEGDVVRIGARSTTVLTNDNIDIIIPNSKLITENVVNWTHGDRKVRFRIPVSVAFNVDIRKVEKALLEAAGNVPEVLETPAPAVRFLEFGENGLEFELRAWTTTLVQRRGKFTSEINFAIYDKLKEHEIEVPYPQRDIHIRSGPIDLRRETTPAD
ncbi:MAG TPA: mechanosensitive ion channel domain-containing protein [Pyrinomonadaceae bacterium]|nr:mechanosensitive ion channel domain-containing protein [Pyrinomonadaceae bacterium]